MSMSAVRSSLFCCCTCVCAFPEGAVVGVALPRGAPPSAVISGFGRALAANVATDCCRDVICCCIASIICCIFCICCCCWAIICKWPGTAAVFSVAVVAFGCGGPGVPGPFCCLALLPFSVLAFLGLLLLRFDCIALFSARFVRSLSGAERRFLPCLRFRIHYKVSTPLRA